MLSDDSTLRLGLFSIGLDTYWDQFSGLHDRLLGYHGKVRERLAGLGARVTDAGLVDSPDKAQAAAGLFRSERVDMVVLFITTYALSSTVLPVVRTVKAPVVILNLQPVAAPGTPAEGTGDSSSDPADPPEPSTDDPTE